MYNLYFRYRYNITCVYSTSINAYLIQLLSKIAQKKI